MLEWYVQCIGGMAHTNNTPRATSFVILTGPNGSRRVALVSGKTRKGQVQALVSYSAFMQAYNAVLGAGQFVVTLAGVPCKFRVVDNGTMVQLTCKAKATHGVGYSATGRVKYSRSQVANCY